MIWNKPLFSADAWSYNQLGDKISLVDVENHIFNAGLDGFNLLLGADSFPKLTVDSAIKEFLAAGQTAEARDKSIASITLVSFDLASPEDCVNQLNLAVFLARAMKSRRINLLPRKNGISHKEGFDRFEEVWKKSCQDLIDEDLVISAENHVWFPNKDDDIFLLHTGEDFIRMVEFSHGQIQVKFDPAWLCRAGDDPLKSFEKCLPYISILDLKDYKNAKFVSPGTGIIPFKKLFSLVNSVNRIIDFSVEVEEHLDGDTKLTDPEAIERLQRSAVDYYRELLNP
jgi:sugar phosphate isomerase/epimerase